jgi:hypothetical protein
MNLKRYLLEEIDSGVKKIKRGDKITFFKGKSDYMYQGTVTLVTKRAITIKSISGETVTVLKSEMSLPED